jgi:hypothetical protein
MISGSDVYQPVPSQSASMECLGGGHRSDLLWEIVLTCMLLQSLSVQSLCGWAPANGKVWLQGTCQRETQSCVCNACASSHDCASLLETHHATRMASPSGGERDTTPLRLSSRCSVLFG